MNDLPELSHRITSIPPSGIRRMFEAAQCLRSTGREVADLTLGRPDFDTPAAIKAAAVAALNAGEVHYTANRGLPELCRGIAADLQEYSGLVINPERGVVVTIGANEAVFAAMAAVLDAGDEVMCPVPCWPHYMECARLLGARPVLLPLSMADGWEPDPDRIRAAITPRTRMLVLNTPHNPTGSVISAERLRAIAAVAADHNLVVLSDEIYSRLVYGRARHLSIGTQPGMAERTITVSGFSKAYAMDGWRLGYAAGPDRLIDGVLRVHQYTTVCAAAFAQRAAVTALTLEAEVQRMREELERRAELVAGRLRSLPGVRFTWPQGALYVFMTVPDRFDSDEDAALALLEAGVASVPGSAFGPAGSGHLRLSFAPHPGVLEMALYVLEKTLGSGKER